MARLLFTIESVFPVRGRGIVLFPGIVPIGEERFRAGDALMLRRVDGSELRVTIGGLDMGHGRRDRNAAVPVLVGGLAESDAPVGSQVWSVDVGAGPSSPELL